MEHLKQGKNRDATEVIARQLALYGPVIPARLDEDERINLYHILAVAHLRLNEVPKAVAAMERVRTATKTNRSIQLNDALVDLQTTINTGRAVDTLNKLLSAGAVEEPAVNMLGYGLSRMETNTATRGRATRLWPDYEQYQRQLTPPKPGLKRLANRWVEAAEFSAFEAKQKAAEDERTRLEQRVKDLSLKAADAQNRAELEQQRYNQIRQRNPRATMSRALIDAIANSDRAKLALQAAQRDFNNAPKPPPLTYAAPPTVGLDPDLVLAQK